MSVGLHQWPTSIVILLTPRNNVFQVVWTQDTGCVVSLTAWLVGSVMTITSTTIILYYLVGCVVWIRGHGDMLWLLLWLLGFGCLDLGGCGVFVIFASHLVMCLATSMHTGCQPLTVL